MGTAEVAAFESLKVLMVSTPVLGVFDPRLKTRVVTDASDFSCGAVLE